MNFLILYSILYQRITGTSHINHVIHLWNLLVVFRHLTCQTFLFLSPAVLMVLFFTCDFSHLNYLFLHMIFFTIHFHMWFLYNSLFSSVIFFKLLFFAIFHVVFFFTCIFFPHVNATQFIIFTYFSRSVFFPPDFFSLVGHVVSYFICDFLTWIILFHKCSHIVYMLLHVFIWVQGIIYSNATVIIHIITYDLYVIFW